MHPRISTPRRNPELPRSRPPGERRCRRWATRTSRAEDGAGRQAGPPRAVHFCRSQHELSPQLWQPHRETAAVDPAWSTSWPEQWGRDAEMFVRSARLCTIPPAALYLWTTLPPKSSTSGTREGNLPSVATGDADFAQGGDVSPDRLGQLWPAARPKIDHVQPPGGQSSLESAPECRICFPRAGVATDSVRACSRGRSRRTGPC